MSLIDTIVLMVLCVTALSPLFAAKTDGTPRKTPLPVVLLFGVVGMIGLGHGLIRMLQAVPVLDVMIGNVFGAAEVAA